MIAKVSLGAIGLGAIGIGGVAFTKPEWLGINRETKWAPLSKDSGFNDSDGGTYKDKFGSSHKNYLVGLDAINEDWWKEKYASIKGQSHGNGKFKNVSNGYGSTDKDLKKVCEDAYKETEANFQGTNVEHTKFKKDEVWKYCSYIGEKPKTVGEENDEADGYSTEASSNPIGKSKKDELLSVKGENNTKLWKLKNDEFFGLGVFKTESEKTAPTEKFFAKLFNGDDKGSNALKNRCTTAYGLTSTENPTNNETTSEAEVLKYCSLKSIK